MSPLTFALEFVLAAIALLYSMGAWRVWLRAGWGHGVPIWRAACFLAGILLLGALLAGPMDALADRSLAGHMLQHILLMKAVPPMLLLGEFSVVFLHAAGGETAQRMHWAWRHSHLARRAWNKLTNPWLAWSFFGLSMWLWHTPPLYDAALQNEWLHVFEHASFFASSLLFWWYILKPGADRAMRYGAVLLYLFTTLLHESALGALLTFSGRNWYPFYASADPWGMSPLADQQLAGLLMWVPGGLLFSLLVEYYFAAWLRAIERRMKAVHPEYRPVGDGHD